MNNGNNKEILTPAPERQLFILNAWKIIGCTQIRKYIGMQVIDFANQLWLWVRLVIPKVCFSEDEIGFDIPKVC